MTTLHAFARRYGPLAGYLAAAATLTGVLLATCGRDKAEALSTEGRLAAVETWRRDHDATTRPLIEEFRKVQRGQVALLVWARMVSEYQGWPVPPEPARAPEPTCGPGEGLIAGTMP